jgi:hypothetical protein
MCEHFLLFLNENLHKWLAVSNDWRIFEPIYFKFDII